MAPNEFIEYYLKHMNNTFKVLVVIILSFLAKNIVEFIFLSDTPAPFSTYTILSLGGYLVCLTLFWGLFLRDKNSVGSFFQRIMLKKIYLVVAILFVVSYTAYAIYVSERYKKEYDYSHFLDNNVYYNSQYNFKFTYPPGSEFDSSNTGGNFATRLFLPNGKTIAGDQENIGILVTESDGDIDSIIKEWDKFSANGPIDTKKEIQFGGQRGYRIIFTTHYSAEKGTKELFYLTVKDGVLYGLNYFPVVEQTIPTVDLVAQSFEFTQ